MDKEYQHASVCPDTGFVRGKHSPKGEIVFQEPPSVKRPKAQGIVRSMVFELASNLPWLLVSAVLSIAAIIILNSGMSLSDIKELLAPTALAIGRLFS